MFELILKDWESKGKYSMYAYETLLVDIAASVAAAKDAEVDAVAVVGYDLSRCVDKRVNLKSINNPASFVQVRQWK